MAPLLSTLPERIAFNVFFTALGSSFVGMRLYVRYLHNQGKKIQRTKVFILSDFFMCVAWAIVTTLAAVDIYQVNEERIFKNKMSALEAQMALAARAAPAEGQAAMPDFALRFIVITLKVCRQWGVGPTDWLRQWCPVVAFANFAIIDSVRPFIGWRFR